MPQLSPEVLVELNKTVDHLNAYHADSVLLVVQHVLDDPAACDAEIVAIGRAGVDFSTSSGGQVERRRVEWAEPIGSFSDAQRELFALLEAARRSAGPDRPLTSLELELATTSTLSTYTSAVAAVFELTPNLLRIDLEGGLDGFTSVGGDQFVYLMVPRNPGDAIPPGFTMADQRVAGPDGALIGAYYTVRSWDPAHGRLTLWVVTHGHPEGIGAWAGRCVPGDSVAVWGPRHGFGTGHRGSNHLYITDETGLAAVAALLESLPPGYPAEVLAETIDEDHVVALPGADITWLYRRGEPAGSDRLFDAVRAASLAADGLVAWGAGESRLMTRIRKHLREERGIRATQLHVTGYWRRSAGSPDQ